jgi:tetratricopeptide (TPR) repeat protein
MMCCASCGIAEVDDIKLKKCTDCDLVRYCSDRCQREHRTKHEAICIKRAAELRDEILFRQPEGTDQGDCPICFLPFPIDVYDYTLLSCCSKLICNGCAYAHTLRTKTEENPLDLCPFCRQPIPGTQEQMDQIVKKRIEANDPVEILRLGSTHLCEGDYERAFEYYTKAVGLGNIEAHYRLGSMYREGQGVEMDIKKEIYHLEEAAIGDHIDARYYLACHEGRNEKIDRAVKHLIIATNLGHDESLQKLVKCYAYGDVSKEDFAAALRAYQTAVDATKSPQREAAAKADAAGEGVEKLYY